MREGRGAIELVGHPFAPIGRGEDIRTCYRALASVGMRPRLIDVFDSRRRSRDTGLEEELAPALDADRPEADVRIYFLNGDEIEHARRVLRGSLSPSAFEVIYPAWELSRYPREWGDQLEEFDEVWVHSQFVAGAVEPLVSKPVAVVPLPVEPTIRVLKGRRVFGIPESAFAFLFMMDLRSYRARKNPEGAVEAFQRFAKRRPSANVVLVLKVLGASSVPAEFEKLRRSLGGIEGRVVILTEDLSDSDTKSLVWCCDAFLSLHRSEGYGRCLAEAMYFGKPVVATGYSGNLEFMTENNSCLVGHELVAVPVGGYPHWLGQVWAEPRVEEAVACMERLVDDQSFRLSVGTAGRRTVETELSYLACGLRIRERLRRLRLHESG